MKKLRDSNIKCKAKYKMQINKSYKLQAINEKLRTATNLLNESEQKYKLLIDNMSDMVWITDSNGIVTFINDEIENVLGIKKELMLMKPLNRIMCPLHQYENCSNIIEEMKNRDFYRQELWMLHNDGKTRKIVETNTKRLYSNGELIGVQGVGRDITERIRMELALKKKNNQLSMLNDISSSIASNKISQNLVELFDNIALKIVDTTHVSFCSIRLLKEDGTLHCISAAGSLKDRINLAPFEVDAASFEHVLKQQDYKSFDEMCKGYVLNHCMDMDIFKQLQNMLFMPIIMNNKPVGLITLYCTEKLDEDYIDILTSIANNITFAIERVNLYTEQKRYYLKTIKTLIAAIEAKDTYTQDHSVRVAHYSVMIAKELNMSEEELEEIEIAGILHDIGKIGISDSILTKPGLLEPNEFESIKEHPSIGCRILEPIGLSKNIINAMLLHHKRFDLKGYPIDTDTTELPIQASIICAADAYDAMTTNRSYKQPLTKDEAVIELKRHSGTQFSPQIVEIMIKLHSQGLL